MNTRIVGVVVLAFVLCLGVNACKKDDPRWSNIDAKSKEAIEAKKQAQESGALPTPQEGGIFNAFFPKNEPGFELVASQEKTGFAEYKLKKNGTDLAMIAISDIANNPQAAEKFASATKTIAGFPVVEQGNTATALLVGGRFQVKVLSRSLSFTKADREAWLQKVNLAGLAALSTRK
ncbi:MAG: hypothetical protein RML40_01485 [Bacteroidota bacterium]|nr:hypothetical protein [Candidatus Kapabacteria bacterium]MDW8219180.1 hypothetical protein [Bacteroidota bacterium]